METSNNDQNNFPLETSDTSAPKQSGTPDATNRMQSTFADLATKFKGWKPLRSDIVIGTHTKISTPLSVGFVLTWWGPEYSIDSLENLIDERSRWLIRSMEKETLQAGEEEAPDHE